MKKLTLFVTLALTFNLVGCGGPLSVKGLDGKRYSWSKTAQDLAEEINQELSDNSIDVTFTVSKARTDQYGFVVYEINNPNIDPLYVAIDIRGFKFGMEIEDFLGLGNIIPFITDLTGSGSSSVGFHVPGLFINLTKEGKHYRYDNNGVNMIFAEDVDGTKDLETMGAQIESAVVSDLADNLTLNYGLSLDRAEKIARLTSTYQKLGSKRSLTESEMNQFTQELVGMDYNRAKSALEKHIQGDDSDFEELMRSASEKNGIDPEHVTSILGELLLR